MKKTIKAWAIYGKAQDELMIQIASPQKGRYEIFYSKVHASQKGVMVSSKNEIIIPVTISFPAPKKPAKKK